VSVTPDWQRLSSQLKSVTAALGDKNTAILSDVSDTVITALITTLGGIIVAYLNRKGK
jgi:hypothetical protein